jgi:hypothetical protein
MAPLATAYVRVRPKVDQAEFRRDISKGVSGSGKIAETEGKKFGQRFTSFAASGIALLGGVQVFASFIKAAQESAKITAQTEAVIKSTGGAAHITAGQVGELATSIMNKTAVDDEAIKSGQNMLLTFTNIRNETGAGNKIFNQASQALTDMTAAMTGGDVSAESLRSQAIQLGKALNDPVKGATALRRVGVSLTEQQTGQIAAFVKSGETMKAQKVILGELSKEFGGSAKAMATPSERLKTAFGELEESIGTKLLPVMNSFINFASKHTGLVFGLAGAVVGLAVAAKTAAAAQILWNIALAANPIGIVVTALAALAAGVIYAYKNFQWFRDFVSVVWHGIVAGAKWFADQVLNFFGMIIHGAATLFGWLPGGIGEDLKKAAAKFDDFHRAVDNALSFKDKTVNVGVKLSSVGTGPFAGKQLAAGWRVPGYGGGDKWPALLEGGEAVVPKHLVSAIAPFLAAHRVPGFAAGGIAGQKSMLHTEPMFASVPAMAAASLAIIRHLAQANAGSLLGGYSGALGGDQAANMTLARRLFPWPAYMWQSYYNLEMGEAGFNRFARNPTSGAYGIPQALPESKLPFAGQAAGGSHAGPQIGWMYGYIGDVYTNPVNAYAQWLARAPHWYGAGLDAVFRSPTMIGVGERGAEHVRVTPPGGEDAMLAALNDVAGLLAALRGDITGLRGDVQQNAYVTADGVAGALGGAAATSMYRAEYSPRG